MNFLKIYNKKAFSLIEVILSTLLSCIAIGTCVYIFMINNNTSAIRFDLLNNIKNDTGQDVVRNVLKEGHINKNETRIEGTIVKPKELVLMTTYFSRDINKPEKYMFLCNETADSKGALNGKKNSENSKELFRNVSACSFEYYDLNGDRVVEYTSEGKIKINQEDITAIKLKIRYKTSSGENKDVVVFQKLMQET